MSEEGSAVERFDAQQLAELRESVRRGSPGIIEAARVDAATFCEFVLKDEGSGRPIVSERLHLMWHDLLDKHDRTVIMTNAESGKSWQITIGRSLWDLGRNPRERIIQISETKKQAQKFLRSVAGYIKNSRELKEVFPKLRPGPVWSMDEGIIIDRYDGEWSGELKDFSVEPAGMDGSILGARYSKAYIDDFISWSSTLTEYQCEKSLGWLLGVMSNRLLDHAKVAFICNAWREQDAAHHLGRKKSWHLARTGVVAERDVTAASFEAMSEAERQALTYTWRDHWYPERILRYIEDFGYESADRALFAHTPKEAARKFPEDAIRACMARGQGMSLVDSREALGKLPENAFLVCGVDLATRRMAMGKGIVARAKKTDLSTFFVLAAMPAPESRTYGDLRLVHVESGRLAFGTLKDVILRLWEAFGCTFVVEDNGTQIWLHQEILVNYPEIPIHGFHTGKNKWQPEFGIEGMAAEFTGNRWVIPSYRTGDGTLTVTKEIARWLDGLRRFSPDDHTSDHVIASWLAREGARRDRFRPSFAIAGDPVTEAELAKFDAAEAAAEKALKLHEQERAIVLKGMRSEDRKAQSLWGFVGDALDIHEDESYF